MNTHNMMSAWKEIKNSQIETLEFVKVMIFHEMSNEENNLCSHNILLEWRLFYHQKQGFELTENNKI
jgi:hypothetical protein